MPIANWKIEHEQIKKLLNEGALSEAKLKLDKLSVYNEGFYSLYANYYYLTGNYEEGISLLEEGMKQIPFSFEITYNLALLKSLIGDFINSLYLFAKCIRVSTNSTDKKDALEQFVEVMEQLKLDSKLSNSEIMKHIDEAKKIINETDEREYPINRFNESLVDKVVKDRENNLYLTKMYKSFTVNNVDNFTRYFFKNEIMPGTTTDSYTITIESNTTVPIGLIGEYDDVHVEGPDCNYVFPKDTLNPNQFNYYTFQIPGEYKFSSNFPFFIGKPIHLKPKKNDVQVIVSIFIDGFAQSTIENNFEKLMPNTFRFFSKGYINNNCYTTGDWTLPSVSAIYTGKTTVNHGLYHPLYHYELNKYNRLFTEDFKTNGYLTAQINNDWRVTPTYGYIQGMDRILYQNSVGGFFAGEVIAETIEHLETFKDNNHFLWISLMDLHDVADEIYNDLYSQVHLPAENRQNKNLGPTSVLSKYDPDKIKKYDVELQRIDLHLSNLLNYLEKTFGMENILVSLLSDHGQTYLKEDEFLLHEPKRKVPFMLAGSNIEPKVSNEICSIIDIFPTMAKIAGVEVDSQEGKVLKDFGGEGREFAMTETLHPAQPYLVAITDEQHIFRFQTKENVTSNTLIDLEYYEAWLLNKDTLEDVTKDNMDKLQMYCDMVIERASKLQLQN
ncbi:MAG: sulfatase-like hydrolase/transferase [Lysinibacillus sp.]|nr:sulfatase-like hydrolase/transferase [Lysinibacillus sp.]